MGLDITVLIMFIGSDTLQTQLIDHLLGNIDNVCRVNLQVPKIIADITCAGLFIWLNHKIQNYTSDYQSGYSHVDFCIPLSLV